MPAPSRERRKGSSGRVIPLYRKPFSTTGPLGHRADPTLKSVTVGMWVNAGSRDESPAQAGYPTSSNICFSRGRPLGRPPTSPARSSRSGANMNAFTTRETTTFYVKVLDQHLPKALELLSDLFHRSASGRKKLKKRSRCGSKNPPWFQDDPEDWFKSCMRGSSWAVIP